MTRSSLVTFVALAALAFAGLQCSRRTSVRDEPESRGKDPKIVLKIAYPPGRFQMVSEQTMNSDMYIEVCGMDQEFEIKQNVAITCDMDVTEPDAEGTYTVVLRFTRFRASMDQPVPMVLDTDNPASLRSNPAGGMISSLLRTPVTVSFDRNGTPVHVSGMDFGWAQTGGRDLMNAQVMGQMKNQLGGDSMAQMVSQAMQMAPKGPVGVGAVWYPDMKVPMPVVGDVRCQTKCKLVALDTSRTEPVAKINMWGLVTAGGSKTMNMGPASMKFDTLEIELQGYTTVDVDTGLTIEQAFDFEGEMALSAGGGGNSMVMEMSFTGTMKTTVMPVESRGWVERNFDEW